MTPLHRRDLLTATLGLGAALTVPTVAATPEAPKSMIRQPARRIEVMGHRGACALRPEHTLASYAKAIADGADFIEPDLRPTKDGALIASHEIDLSKVTNIAEFPEFAGRRRQWHIGNVTLEGWFAIDFTLAELKKLRLKERITDIRPANTQWDNEFQILCLDEIIDFVAAEAATRGRPIGIIPELKEPSLFASIGAPVEAHFTATIAAHSYLKTAPLIVQCFEIQTLKTLRNSMGEAENVRFMQLIDDMDKTPLDVAFAQGHLTYADMMTKDGLEAIHSYADIISPDIRTWIPLTADGRLGATNPALETAKAVGLQISGWEFRPENRFMAADFRDGAGDNTRNPKGSIAEIHRYLAAGMDSFFTDDPGIGRQAVDSFTQA